MAFDRAAGGRFTSPTLRLSVRERNGKGPGSP
jgi:hypothetical protein